MRSKDRLVRVDARAWQCETKFRDRSDLGTGIRCIGCACRGTRASHTADRRLCLVWFGFARSRWRIRACQCEVGANVPAQPRQKVGRANARVSPEEVGVLE